MQARNWCFTINNYGADEILQMGILGGLSKYLIYGFEKGKKGTPHIQGYVEFDKPWRFNRLKKQIPTAHIEQRKGPRVKAMEYCKKEGKYEEVGKFVEDGCRTDLDEIKIKLDEQVKMLEIAEDYFGSWVRYNKAFEKYRTMKCSKKLRQLKVVVYQGIAGSGKTYKAFHKSESVYILNGGKGEKTWFDGYDGQDTLLIDDFEGWIPYYQLLRILDVYPYRCDIKGSFTVANWKKVYITTNLSIDEWYEHTDISSLERRIHKTVKFTKKWNE